MYKYPAPGATSWNTWADRNVGGKPPVQSLVGDLIGAGCKVTKGREYLELYTARTPVAPARKTRLLDMTADEYIETVIEAGTYAATQGGISESLLARHRELDDEMRESMRSEVNSYLDALRPAFDKAADAARALIKKGVQPNMTAEDVIELDPAVAGEWSEFRRGTHIGALNRIMSLRAGLARGLDLEDGEESDFGAGIGAPGLVEKLAEQTALTRHVAWLQAASSLALRPFDLD